MLGLHSHPFKDVFQQLKTERPLQPSSTTHACVHVCAPTQQEEALLSLSLRDRYINLCKDGHLDHALEVLKKMEQDCALPSPDLHILFLKQCIKGRALIQAKGMYIQLCLHGLESNCSMGEFLIRTFVKCGDLDDALRMVHALPCCTDFCWTAILAGFTDCGRGEEALKMYKCMCELGIEPNEYTFVSLLKACASLHALEEGKVIYADAQRMGFYSNGFIVNTLVSMYIKCGHFAEAEVTFKRLPMQNTASWNVMLSAYIEQGQPEDALLLFRQMQEECARPDNRTLVYALQACCAIAEKDNCCIEEPSMVWEDSDTPVLPPPTYCLQTERTQSDASTKALCLDIGRGLHALARKLGLQSDIYVGTNLVRMYGQCGSLSEAEKMFSSLPEKNVVSWNTMLSVYVDHDEGEKALRLLEQMVEEGVDPAARTYVICLQACCIVAEKEVAGIKRNLGKFALLEIGQVLHACVSRKHLDSNAFIRSALITVFGKCGRVEEAENIFNSLPSCDTVLWNSLLSAYVELGEEEKAFGLYGRMHEAGQSIDELTLVMVLQACCLHAAKATNNEPTGVTPKDIGRALHADAIMKGLEQNAFISSTLICMYGKRNSIMDSQNVFVGLVERNLVLWNSMLTAYVEQGEVEAALLMYRQTKEEGLLPNSRTIISALQACGILAEEYDDILKGHSNTLVGFEISLALHAEARRRGFDVDAFVACTLIGVYSKCGKISNAESVFAQLAHRDVVAWTVLLSAYVDQGEGERALQLYVHMQSKGCSPTHLTILNALQACSILAEKAEDLAEEKSIKEKALIIGQALHEDVRRKGFDSDLYISNTLITFYGKCSCIAEAEEVFCGMSERNIVSWNAMIQAYNDQGQSDKSIQLHRQVQLEALCLDEAFLIGILQACSRTGDLAVCRQVHFIIASAGIDHLLVETSLIHAYGSCASMKDAQAVFDFELERDVVFWNALMAGYAHIGEYCASLQCYEKMQGAHVEPNEVTFLSLLSVCNHMGFVGQGVEYFESMSRDFKLTQNIEHYIAVIDLLGRTGDFTRIQDIVSKMPIKPNLALWHSLLSACVKYGNVELGEQAYKQAVFLQPEYASSYVLMWNIYNKAEVFDHEKELSISGK